MNDSQYKLSLLIESQNLASRDIERLQWDVERLQKQMQSAGQVVQGMMWEISSYAQWIQKSLSTISFSAIIQAAKEVWNVVSEIGKEVSEMINKAANLEPVENAFRRLSKEAGVASDQMLSAMKKASLGTVSEFNLMSAANKAYSLWVASNTEQMTTLIEIARVKGQAFGRTMTEALDDIVTGLGRGSAPILDNIGIVVNQTEAQKAYAESIGKTVEQLSEAEKKQALVNTVVAQGKAELEAMGNIPETFAEKQAKLLTTFEDISTLFGKTLLSSIWGLYDKMNGWLDQHIKSIELAITSIGETIGNVFDMVVDNVSVTLEIISDIFGNAINWLSETVKYFTWENEEVVTGLKWDWSDFFYYFQQGIATIVGVVQIAVGGIKGTREGLKAVAYAVVNDIYTAFSWGASGIAQVFSNIVSDVTTNLKKMANYAIKAINWLAEQANKIPGVNLGKLDLFTITESWTKSSVWMLTKLFTEPIKWATQAGQKALDGMIDTYVNRVQKLNEETSLVNWGGGKKMSAGGADANNKDKKWGSKADKKSGMEDLKKEMEEYAKGTKDLYKSIQKEADNWLSNQVKNINELDKEYQKSFDKIQDKIDETTKKIESLNKEIGSLKQKLVDLQTEQTQSVAKEYVNAKKELQALEEQYKGLKEVADGVSREDLKWVGGIGKYDVDLIKKYKDYQDEMKSAYTWLSEEERKAMDQQIAYQERYRWLNNVEKIKEDYRIKKEEVQAELDQKIAALALEQDTLRANRKEQQKLQDEWIKRINEEIAKRQEVADKKKEFEKKYMEILEINHQKQVDMTNKLVEQWNAVYRAKMRAMSAGSADWSRASGWPVYQGNAYLVGETWPELFVPSSHGKIVKNSDLWGAGGNISVNVNLGNVAINNGSDENALTQKITESILRELVLYKKGIR